MFRRHFMNYFIIAKNLKVLKIFSFNCIRDFMISFQSVAGRYCERDESINSTHFICILHQAANYYQNFSQYLMYLYAFTYITQDMRVCSPHITSSYIHCMQCKIKTYIISKQVDTYNIYIYGIHNPFPQNHLNRNTNKFTWIKIPVTAKWLYSARLLQCFVQ